MGFLLIGVGALALIGAFVCQIMVLIKMFQTEGPLYGILGLLCGIYALIWGWMNADKLNIKNIMMAWTGLLVVGILFYMIGGAVAAM